jgi:hypothetical protein
MALIVLLVAVQALLAFLVMVETAAEMPLEPAKMEPTRLDTEPVVAEVGVVVLVEMGRKVMSALFTGAQTKC